MRLQATRSLPLAAATASFLIMLCAAVRQKDVSSQHQGVGRTRHLLLTGKMRETPLEAPPVVGVATLPIKENGLSKESPLEPSSSQRSNTDTTTTTTTSESHSVLPNSQSPGTPTKPAADMTASSTPSHTADRGSSEQQRPPAQQEASKLDAVVHVSNLLKNATEHLQDLEKEHVATIQEEQEKAAKFAEDKQEVTSMVEHVENTIQQLKRRLSRARRSVSDAETNFLRDVGFGIVDASEIPHALSVGTTPQDCPTVCDPIYCDESPDTSTHCFRSVWDDEAKKRTRYCRPFKDETTFKCPRHFVPCSLVSPDRGRVYTLNVSTAEHPVYHELQLTGHNLHSCIRLAFVPKNVPCNPRTVPLALHASIPIMGLGGSTAYPQIINGRDSKAEFKRVQLLKKGEFHMCLIQFARPKDAKGLADFRVLAAEVIGTVRGVEEPKAGSTTTTAEPTTKVVRADAVQHTPTPASSLTPSGAEKPTSAAADATKQEERSKDAS